MNNWNLVNKIKIDSENFDEEEFIRILLENRGLKTKKEIEEYINPRLEDITPKNLDMSLSDIKKAKKRLEKAKNNNEQIIVFGDYDVDGITGTAILWEVLNKNKFRVMPYIPERAEEGYGLSVAGIDNLLKKYPDTKLIITVDNGIVAEEAVDYANKSGIHVIITDHHAPAKSLPKAFAIIHSVKICGSAVSYVFSNELFEIPKSYLELVAMATVSDVMTLTSYNRILLVHGLKELRNTKRIGLNKLIEVAGTEKEKIGVYELGNVLGPRINAMGRIGSGMDSLRLLCTQDNGRAHELANLLNNTNAKRQQMTFDSTDHARKISSKNKKIIVLADESYNQGIVGLISGRITEEFYRPSVVIAKEKGVSKGSARSVKGVSIIQILREAKGLLLSVGGHPGAAGFSIETKNISEFKKRLEVLAEEKIDDKLLIKKTKIDLELSTGLLNLDLFTLIQKLAPFGFGNPEPIFMSKNLNVESMRFVGKENKHLKLTIRDDQNRIFSGIYFGYKKDLDLEIGSSIDMAYMISLNSWNGSSNLDLKVRDIKS